MEGLGQGWLKGWASVDGRVGSGLMELMEGLGQGCWKGWARVGGRVGSGRPKDDVEETLMEFGFGSLDSDPPRKENLEIRGVRSAICMQFASYLDGVPLM